MGSICLIVVYFGDFPNYFDLWLDSVKMNADVNFLIITDNKIMYQYPANVTVKQMSFATVKCKIENMFDFNNKLNSPYKLSDYKCAYGDIFYEYIKEYDFWGYCDVDLIFGDIRKFITDDLLRKYEKINMHGHFSLYKNNQKMRQLYKEKCKGVVNYKNAYTSDWIYHFDEYPGVSYIAELKKINYVKMEEFADLDWTQNRFVKVYDHSEKKSDANNIKQLFRWSNGKLYNIILDEEVKEKELMYVHLQKRTMINEISTLDNGYYIIANKFINMCNEQVGEVINRQLQEGKSPAYLLFKKECVSNRFKFDYWKYKFTMIGKKK